MTAPVAIPGTRRQLRELVDGTIRVQIDIDPPYRKAFLEMFHQIDMAVAIAPLELGPTAAAPKAEIGPRCMLAVQWCKDAKFQGWAIALFAPSRAGFHDDEGAEKIAKEIVCDECAVESRRYLDTNPEAGARFDEVIRRPYQAHLRSTR